MTDSAQDGRQKVRTIIEKTGVGMLTTLDADGGFVSRPMLALLIDGDAGVYFLTHSRSPKVVQIAAEPRVALSFVGSDGMYLSMVGRASAVRDAALVERLWNPTYRAWFPDGAGDPDVTVLRVEVDRADFWEAPGSRVVRLIEAVTAVVTRTPYETPRTTVTGS
jgi:general stress protein 26